MTDGKIMQKQATCHGYKMMELSNRDVMVIDPHGKPIARTTSFREATRIIEADVRMLNRLDGTEDPFQCLFTNVTDVINNSMTRKQSTW